MDFASSFPGVSSFTIEMDPGPGQKRPGFELPEDWIQMVFERNIRAALALISAAEGDWGGALRYSNWDVNGRGNRLPV